VEFTTLKVSYGNDLEGCGNYYYIDMSLLFII